MRKKILVVAYHYFPEEGSCSEKNSRIVKKLVDSGYEVVVLTKGYHNYNNYDIGNTISIIRTDHNGIFHRKQDVCCKSQTSLMNKSNWLNKLKYNISNSFVPDSIIDWIPKVNKLYNNNKNIFKNIDIIISISSPYSAHIVSHFISKKIGAPVVMCYGDPWIYEPKRKRGKLRYMIERSLEQKLLNSSAKVLLITEWNKKKYHQIYGIPYSKIYTYNIGYDKQECLIDKKIENSGEFKIIYGGSLDMIHRNPEPFIEAMSRVDGIKAYIYNSDNPYVKRIIDKYRVNDKVILKPIIKSSEFYNEMYKMDALLLFGNKTPFQVPGKVFTYISTRKGIIYIKNNEYAEDGTEEILNKYGHSVTVSNNAMEISECLKKMKKNNVTNKKINADIFDFHNTMKPIVEAIEDIEL
ncbi:hypothetical protein H5999_10310 [[Clostridium] spiroforme]|nr:hypothetical protein [Thomasclavelia spiroformis]